MSYEPDTQDRAIRSLKEEISRIREEQFSKAFGTGSGGSGVTNKSGGSIGGALPATGTASFYPNVIRITKDTGVIKKLSYKLLTPTKNFAINEMVTGATSGATGLIGDIDITGTLTGVLFWKTITGTFTANETINGNINGQAKADLAFLITQTGRSHLNAGSASIIAEAVESPAEIHFIDNANQNGQFILLRAQNGQTIRVRRAITQDANTGNIDLDNSFNIIENAIVILQYQATSNATPTGGWVPVLSSVSSGGTSVGGLDFPILYPKEDLGDKGSVSVSLLLNQANGHYKRIRLIGDISLQFNSDPPAINGFKFYVLIVQDGVGGHVISTIDSTVKNGASILTQIDPNANAQTLLQFVTADGGLTYHGQVIQPSGGGDASQWSFFKALTDVNMDSRDIYNIDKLIFLGAGGFNFPFDGILQAISTSPVGLQFNVAPDIFASYRWYNAGFEVMSLDFPVATNTNTLTLTNGDIVDIHKILFHESPGFLAQIRVNPNELVYTANGVGAFHSFVIDNNEASPNFEMRLNVNKSNRNLDMVTNDIINLDQAQFDPFGGFSPATQHGDRRISGGNAGININIPVPPASFKSLRIWFENLTQTNSNLEYEFNQNELNVHLNNIKELNTLFYFNGHYIAGLISHLEYSANPGTVHQFKIGVGAPILEINNTENGAQQGFIKLFADMNVQTQNINQVDRMSFVSNNGLVGGNQFAIAGDFPVGRGFQFNVPLLKQFRFSVNDEAIMHLSKGLLDMRPTVVEPDPAIVSHQYALVNHSQGTVGMGDGTFRSVANGPNSDVWVATGGIKRNLTSAGTSFIGFMADADLDMNTLNIFNLDVLRFAKDSGVIGFGEYGMAVESSGSKLKWSVPAGKSYEWQVNLNPIASLNSASFHMSTNASVPSPSIIADGSFIIGLNHISGVLGMDDGYFRTIQSGPVRDVIVHTGGLNVNLTTLGAGGSDNLGNHIAIMDLLPVTDTDLDFGNVSQAWRNIWAQNYEFTSTGGPTAGNREIFGKASGMAVNLPIGTSLQLQFGGVFAGEFTNNTIQGFNNIILDNSVNINNSFTLPVADGQFTRSGADVWVQSGGLPRNLSLSGGGVTEGQSVVTWTGNHTFNGTLLTIGNATSDTITINSRINSNLDPVSDNSFSLGTAGRRWSSLFISGNSNLNGAIFTGAVTHFSTINMSGSKIINLGTPTLPGDAVTKAYADSLGGGGGVQLGDSPMWTGNHTFNGTVGFTNFVAFLAGSISPQAINSTNGTNNGAVTILGTQTISGSKTMNALIINNALRHTGSTVGFYNTSPISKPPSGGFVSPSGATGQLLAVINAHNTMRASLFNLGLVTSA